MKKEKRQYLGHDIDSDEEIYCIMWMEELKNKGYIKNYERSQTFILSQPFKVPYTKITQLKTKSKEEKKQQIILNGCEYTPDFKITWHKDRCHPFVDNMHDMYGKYMDKVLRSNEILTDELVTYLEVKPQYDQNGKTQYFKLNQKWLWDVYGVFVNLFIPIEIFKSTFTPMGYLFTSGGKKKTGKQVAYKVLTLDEYLKIHTPF